MHADWEPAASNKLHALSAAAGDEGYSPRHAKLQRLTGGVELASIQFVKLQAAGAKQQLLERLGASSARRGSYLQWAHALPKKQKSWKVRLQMPVALSQARDHEARLASISLLRKRIDCHLLHTQ